MPMLWALGVGRSTGSVSPAIYIMLDVCIQHYESLIIDSYIDSDYLLVVASFVAPGSNEHLSKYIGLTLTHI